LEDPPFLISYLLLLSRDTGNQRLNRMCDDISTQKNRFLDQILAERRSHRMFRPEPCSEDEIRRILHAGLLAPFAAAAVGNSHDYFRRFFVMRRGSESMKAALPLVMQQVRKMAADLEAGMKRDPALRAKAVAFAGRLSMFSEKGFVPGIGSAPYYIVVAERRGFPPVELQSLAHCLENMWLKATALDLGFQLVSVTSQMSGDPGFCAILGIPPGEWELMGCAVGYPADELSPSIRPPVEDLTRWLD
jgi:nitroreductase